MTNAVMPVIARTMPARLPSFKGLPLCTQPSITIVHVLEWPTTVLASGPASLMMTNCVMLIRGARMHVYKV